MKMVYCHICKEVVEVDGDSCAECGAYLGYALEDD